MSLLVVAAVSVAGVTYVYGCSAAECGGGDSKCCTTRDATYFMGCTKD